MRQLSLLFLLGLGLWGCQKDLATTIPAADEEWMPGGATTTPSSGPDAYTFPSGNLSAAAIQRHFQADLAFEQTFVTYPASQAAGLGPLFNQSSCVSCHTRNGRSQPPASVGDISSGVLMRLSLAGSNAYGGPLPVPGFGGQLQTKAIFGVEPEGKLALSYVQQMVSFLDGEQVILHQPVYNITNTYQALPPGVLTSVRNAPPVFGLGLLEAIPEANLLAVADENDLNHDGISGRPNYVWNIAAGAATIGRFGWKANNPTLVQQAADAFHQDMGISSGFYFPSEHCIEQSNCVQGIGTEPDVSSDFVALTAYYTQTLAVPATRGLDQPDVLAGRQLFARIGCDKCHVPRQQTGVHEIAELSGQVIYPYTDLLLHDMGPGLADDRPDFEANGREWRTAPLWGIGLTQVVNPKATYLHDGRAQTLSEAILWHGGEAETAKESFRQLSKSERSQILRFLEAL